MYLRYTLFKTDKTKVLESYGIGLNVSCIHHAPDVLYELVRDSKSFDEMLQSLKNSNGKIRFNKKVKYGEKAEIVLHLKTDKTVSYSKSFSERVEDAQISDLSEIVKFSVYREMFSCIYFDTSSNQWFSRRCSNFEVLSDVVLDYPLNAQQSLF
ncbi:TPA: hypothetical protein MW242_002905 [Acinetobacter baumannii]|nr:hypothetical protein [Acinetobacter baumannii]